MKKGHIEAAFSNIKYRLVSSDLQGVIDSLKSNTRSSRDFIEVKTLIVIFEKMAKERADK
ncbi:hypothetical protein HYV50_03375 [Candidatus Pacearchaeota archaeon]|nr:hypothetical protein [Candidatus Pacearchaeota archaeon]